jgi:phospholipid/cholesterol/gamma-HCH transport system substrate-binding protein
VAVLVLVGAVVVLTGRGPGYQLKLVLPSAAQLVDGSPVRIDGRTIGSVSNLEVRGERAIATVSLDSSVAPLHEGTNSRIEWQSVLGERVLTLYPGPANNPALPDGYLLEAPSLQIEVDQVLAAFDQPTRQRLNSLISSLKGTLDGREPQLRQTVQTAGPTVQALGDVLKGVGQDGPAIRELVTELHQVTGPLAERRAKVAGFVQDLTKLTDQVAPAQAAIRDGLRELPSTLQAARTTLDLVPPASQATSRLLDDLRPAADRLPSVARNLRPVMRDLRPSVNDLRPVLGSLNDVLERTPDLFDSTHDAFPKLERTVDSYREALAFLRPYTPEAAGFITNWGHAFAPYDSQGHGLATAFAFGATSDNELPAGVPGVGVPRRPLPGALANQPWADANGDGMR